MKKRKISTRDKALSKLATIHVKSLNTDQQTARLTRMQLEILSLIRNGIAHPHELAQTLGISDERARFEKAKLYDRILKSVRQGTSLQGAERRVEKEKTLLPAERLIERTKSLPPRNAEFILGLLVSKEDQEAALGCFEELYRKRVVRLGESRARVWAWCQVGKTVWPVLKRIVLKVSGLIAAYEWLKHHLS